MTESTPAPSHNRRWHWALKHLLAVEIISILLFSAKGYPLVGIIAPLWGIFIPFGVVWDYYGGHMTAALVNALMILSMFLIVLSLVVVASFVHWVPRWAGQTSLTIYNLLSMILILGLE